MWTALTLLVACAPVESVSPAAPTEAPRLAPVDPLPPVMEPLSNLGVLFAGEAEWITPVGPVSSQLERAGTLTIGSEMICLGEPGYSSCTTLRGKVPRGSFPVDLAVVPWVSGGHQPAAAILRLVDRPATTWRPVVPMSEDPAVYASGEEIWAFSSLFGLAGLADPTRWERQDEPEPPVHPPYDIGWVSWRDGGMLGFHTPHKDRWVAYWGYDADGERVALAMDFLVLVAEGKPMEGRLVRPID